MKGQVVFEGRDNESDKEVKIHAKKLDDLVKKSQSILFRCKGVWPFDFFPDEEIDVGKLNTNEVRQKNSSNW